MPIPDYQTLMLPVLRSAAQGEVKLGDIASSLAESLGLSEEEVSELLPSLPGDKGVEDEMWQ
ncbi:winged helix-turn-helix domain-containing protein [Cylindrospermopsis raciborskii]|uniref:Restriction system protein Mrr-like N-terminal domain-containing protein n=1 Tax=Cylindrospermopsis raciborskii CS-505 TaxID=533240 RepID=A0A853MC96_9CYAN|nr:winged helix-turn-helix domain-containing protein [Cylindrospermopsis raciborskii]OBU74818.1 hypothetical protein A9P98_17790 [Cylindrospermopsis raciborskii CS-505]